MSEERRIARLFRQRLGRLAIGVGCLGGLLFGGLAVGLGLSAGAAVALLGVWGVLCGVTAWAVGRLARRASEAFMERVDLARQSERAFISNASHELNNPLTAIQGECEITLLRERSAEEYQDSLRRIAMENHRVIQLIKHLLFLARADKAELKGAVDTFCLADYLMQFTSERVSFSPDNFAFQVEANPYLLKLAIQNLLSNACKYSGDKPVEIRLRGSVLSIVDQGIGIPPDELERVMQPFYRASNAQPYAGHGVGLSLSGRILRVCGAEVNIASRLGEGTTVSIDFKP